MKTYLTNCRECGACTNKRYAAAHGGRCKACETGEAPKPKDRPDKWRGVCHGEMTHAFLANEASLDACPY